MTLVSRGLSVVRAGVRATLRRTLSQDRRTELKRLQGVARKRFAPLLSRVHGTFSTEELVQELARRLPPDFEILMVHSSFDGFLPMYKGSAKELVSALIDFCGPERTLVMPSFVMGGRTYDTVAYFQSRPFDVRRTPQKWDWLPKSSEEHLTFCEAFTRPVASVPWDPWRKKLPPAIMCPKQA